MQDRSSPGTATHPLAGPRARRPAPKRVRVTVVGGPDAGLSVLLDRATGIVGRAEGADVRLADPTVSAFHLEVTSTDEGVRCQDLESRNGTFFHGARVERAVVPSGATLGVGRSLVQLALDEPVAEPAHEVLKFGELRGRSAAMRDLFAALTLLAPTDLSVLIEGPTGTGKELAARALHAASRHAGGPFVVLDCTAVPAPLAESLLFGHEKGAFTGAAERRVGVFEAAEGGTLFLDEVGELPPEVQPKLLRALERREVVRLGSTEPQPVRVRVVCATWRDLRRMVNQGTFREDLYYRLAAARAVIPPLRERPEDVAVLAHHALQQLAATGRAPRALSPEALAELTRREFPGNVRELRAAIECAAIFAAGPVITPTDLAMERLLSGERARANAAGPAAAATSATDAAAPGDPLAPYKTARRTSLDEFERDYLERLLARTGNNLSRASALAGIDRHHLRKLFRKHALRSEEG